MDRDLETIEALIRVEILGYNNSRDNHDAASAIGAPEAIVSQQQYQNNASAWNPCLLSPEHDPASQDSFNVEYSSRDLPLSDPLEIGAGEDFQYATADYSSSGPSEMARYSAQYDVDSQTSFLYPEDFTSCQSFMRSAQLDMTVGGNSAEGDFDSQSFREDSYFGNNNIDPQLLGMGDAAEQPPLDLAPWQHSMRSAQRVPQAPFSSPGSPDDVDYTLNPSLLHMDNGTEEPAFISAPWQYSMEPVHPFSQTPFIMTENPGNLNPRLLGMENQPASVQIPRLPQRSDNAPRVSAQGHVRKPTKGRKGLRSNIVSNGGAKAGAIKDELRDLPQPDCVLPNIVLTAAEIHAYFPTMLKSPEAMMRFVQNGITVSEQASLINWFHGGIFAEKRLSETLKARKAKFTKEKFGSTSRTLAKNKMALPQDNNYGTAHYSQPFGTQPTKYASLLDRANMVEVHPSGADAGAYTNCVLEAIRQNNANLTDGHVVSMMRVHGWQTVPEQGNWDRRSFDRLQTLMVANPSP